MVHREVLKNYPREMLEDITFTEYCFNVLIDSLVINAKCDRKDVKIRVVAYHADCFGLDKVCLIAEVKII